MLWAAGGQRDRNRDMLQPSSGAMYRRVPRLAHPREIRLRALPPALHERIGAAADHSGLTVEAWLVEAAELALLRGSTR